jgi:hypothetical protein
VVNKSIHLTSGIYAGVVKAFYPPNNTLKIKLQGGAVVPCIWAAGIISGMVGFKTSYFPPLKTEVLVFWPPSCDFGYVIGTIPSKFVDTGRQQRSVAGDPTVNYAANNVSMHRTPNKIEYLLVTNHQLIWPKVRSILKTGWASV